MMEDRSNPQPSKFRKLPGGFVLRKEREVLHLFQLPKGNYASLRRSKSRSKGIKLEKERRTEKRE